MLIQVKLFASLREQAGWSERQVPPETHPATPLSLWRQLQLPGCGGVRTVCPASGDAEGNAALAPHAGQASERPGANALPPGIRVAINQQFAPADRPLADGDELAFLPPISGG